MRIFLHGFESSSRGAKATFLRKMCPDIVVPDFTGTLADRMKVLRTVLDGHRNIILVGSSFGGLMATVFAMENRDALSRLILLAPALNFPEFKLYSPVRLKIPTRMIIGRHDTVTPEKEVVPVAEKIFADLQYDSVDDDHMLANTFRDLDWPVMLSE